MPGNASRTAELETRFSRAIFSGFIVAVSDEVPPRYTVRASRQDKDFVLEGVEATIRAGGNAAGIAMPYRVGDRVIVANPTGQTTANAYILGGLFREGAYQDDLPRTVITAQPHNAESVFNNPLVGISAANLLSFGADPDATIEVVMPTDQVRFTDPESIYLTAGGVWRMRITPERVEFIRVREADLVNGIARPEGWVYVDQALIGPQFYYQLGPGSLTYHTYPTMDIRASIGYLIMLPPPVPPRLADIRVLQNVHAPHSHPIPNFAAWQPFRFIWRQDDAQPE